MDQATSVIELRQYLQHWKDHGQSIALIPTMGNLHAGHMSLIEKGQSLCDRSICSIFVNPMQFGPNEDFNHYPRTLDSDIAQLEASGCDLVYLPTASELYPDGLDKISNVQVTDLTDSYEGAHRPGHFTGVLTVVMKLLNLVRPQRAYFGKKDYQQYLLVRDMAETFFMDVEIVGCETVRECDGLAMSSRNKLLPADARRIASKFNRALRSPACDKEVGDALANFGFQVDYIETQGPRRFGAIIVDCGDRTVRLIDNVEVSEVA